MLMKVHLRIFIEVENLGRVMNILADEGVTGFYIVEYRGVSRQNGRDSLLRRTLNQPSH